MLFGKGIGVSSWRCEASEGSPNCVTWAACALVRLIYVQVTGKDFDMEPKTFTLGSMFTLKLDTFAEEILKITSAAEKEVTIESELKKLVEVWKDQKFVIAKYFKGSDDRGWVLRSVDEVMLLLEDMGLNLQSMMASPFVKPFIQEVQSWEQKLSLISECIEVWMQVQRKWMYLESIFVGSDDIRLQLPQVWTNLPNKWVCHVS